MPEEKSSRVKKVAGYFAISFMILGGFYGLSNYFVPFSVFDLVCAQTKQEFKLAEQKINQKDIKQQIRVLEQHQLYLESRELNQMQMQRYENDPVEKNKMREDVQRIRRKKEVNEGRIYKLKNP